MDGKRVEFQRRVKTCIEQLTKQQKEKHKNLEPMWEDFGPLRKNFWKRFGSILGWSWKPKSMPTSTSPKDIPERVWKGAVRTRSCSRGPTTTMAVDSGNRRRRLTTKTLTAKRMGTPTPQHDGAMALPTPRRVGTTTQQHDAARRKPRIGSSLISYVL